jgi:hypothetical protein
MRLTMKERIAFHTKAAKDSADLAAKYARTKDYREASDCYNSAAFHRSVADALKAR